MDGRIYKHVLLDFCRNPETIGYHLRNCGHMVPCQVITLAEPDAVKPGMVWIILKPPLVPSGMRFMVPNNEVFVRTKFMRPRVPFSLVSHVRHIENLISRDGDEKRVRYEATLRDPAPATGAEGS